MIFLARPACLISGIIDQPSGVPQLHPIDWWCYPCNAAALVRLYGHVTYLIAPITVCAHKSHAPSAPAANRAANVPGGAIFSRS